MSSFRVQKMKVGLNPSKKQTFNPLKIIQSRNIQLQIDTIQLLNYQIDDLLSFIQQQAQNQSLSKLLLSKVIKILTLSLNHQNLFNKIEVIFTNNALKERKIFRILCEWSQYVQFQVILAKFSEKIKRKILKMIFIKTILTFSRQNFSLSFLQMKKSIKRIFKILSQNEKIQIKKQIQTEIQFKKNNIQFSQIMKTGYNILEFVSEVESQQDKKFFLGIIESFFKANQQIIKKTVNQSLLLSQERKNFIQNLYHSSQYLKSEIIQLMTSSMNIRSIKEIYQVFKNQIYCVQKYIYIVSSFRHWLNLSFSNKYKQIVAQLYELSIYTEQVKQKQKFVFQCFKYASDQQLFKNLIKQRYLYFFLKGKKYFFEKEGKVINYQAIEKQQFIEISLNFNKSIKHCQNNRKTNVLLLNKTQQLKYWPKLKDIFNISLPNISLKANFQQFLDDLKIIQNKLLKENKKIQISYLVIQVQIKNKLYFFSFQQLIKFINGELFQVSQNIFQNQYGIVNCDQKIKNKENHPIINEAKVVKLLKRSQNGISNAQIAKYLSVKLEDSLSIIQKLVNKGYIQHQQNSQLYFYIP